MAVLVTVPTLIFGCLFGLIALLGTIFWIWTIVDCALSEPSSDEKIMWLLIVILTHFIGAAIYFFARRPTRRRMVGR
jgi:hypothetical protein